MKNLSRIILFSVRGLTSAEDKDITNFLEKFEEGLEKSGLFSSVSVALDIRKNMGFPNLMMIIYRPISEEAWESFNSHLLSEIQRDFDKEFPDVKLNPIADFSGEEKMLCNKASVPS